MRHQLHNTTAHFGYLLVCLQIAASSLVLATPPAIEINQPNTTDAEELCIAVNPTNPDNLAVGANLKYHFHSNDGGVSWTQNTMSSIYGVNGDPCVIFDADGNLYYSSLSYLNGSWLDRIVVLKSTDGGLTWDDGASVGYNPPKDQDKSWLVADRTNSPYRNHVYVAWSEFDTYGSEAAEDSTRILFSRTVDQGASWSAALRISDRGGNCIDRDETVEGATPTVGPAGQVYMAWSGHGDIYFDRSFDGGQTFGEDILITSQPGGWDFEIPGIWRCNGLPITVCDTSNSPYQGRVYVVFSDQRNGTHDTDVFLCFSDDEGTTWSAPSRINDDTGQTQQFFPWLTVDPITGTLAVVYYDRRNTEGNATEVSVAVSNDGGETFYSSIVSDASFTPWSSVFFGDYIGIDSLDGTVYTTWMSMDQGSLSVWMATLSNISAVGSGSAPHTTTNLVMKVPFTISTRQTRIAFTTYQDAPVTLSIYDLRGHLVQTLFSENRAAGQYSEMWDGTDRTGRNVASGMYLVNLKAGRDVVTKKVVIAN